MRQLMRLTFADHYVAGLARVRERNRCVMTRARLCMLLIDLPFAGGQAYTIKLRSAMERSPTAMLLEPPVYINGSNTEYVGWQHMK